MSERLNTARLINREPNMLYQLPESIAQRTLSELLNIKSDPACYIDEGGAATVHHISDSICMKILHDRHTSAYSGLFKLGNSIDQEAYFLETLSDFGVGNTRSPRYVGRIESRTPGEPNILLMEKLDAVNFQHVMNGTAILPKVFSAKKFFDELDRYIVALHTIHKIVHLDLEARNVMIDRETGMPRVIDFGRSRSISSLSKVSKEHCMNKDMDAVEEMYQKWLNCQNKQVML